MSSTVETTLLLIKPHAVRAGHVPAILKMVATLGLQIVGRKDVEKVDRVTARENYRPHSDREYYPWLCRQLTGQPVVVIALRGEDAIDKVRRLAGSTDPAEAAPGTIRELGRFTQDVMAKSRQEERGVDNVVHSSDNANATREVAVWFTPDELLDWLCRRAGRKIRPPP